MSWITIKDKDINLDLVIDIDVSDGYVTFKTIHEGEFFRGDMSIFCGSNDDAKKAMDQVRLVTKPIKIEVPDELD